MSSLIGKSLQGGKYKLESLLGRGGFGLTFTAHQNYLDKVVVIKTLNEAFWRAPNLSDLQRQFQDEARRLALCSHPNVVRVSDFFVEDGLPYMVMDYIPGRSLYDIVLPSDGTPKPLSEAQAISYIQQIGKALQAVHAKGLLHRDVKPQNIMVHQLTGEAVLIDFGIARELTANPAQTHTSIVSEGYAPIEQYLPKAQRSAATDIYGLAATMYTLLTAQIPVAAVLRDRTPLIPLQQLRPDVSQAVADAVTHGLQVELKDRPQSVGRWISALSTQGKTTGLFGRTAKPESLEQAPAKTPQPVSPSEYPTRVVAPNYQSGVDAIEQRSITEQKTVAVPVPTGYEGDTVGVGNSVQVEEKKKGCGCVSTLAFLTVAIAATAGIGGYALYQTLADRFNNLPEIALPEVVVPTPDETDLETTEEDSPEESSDDKPDKKPQVSKDPSGIVDPPVEPDVPDSNDAETTEPVATQPPLLLSNSGNPANAQPGDTGGIVAVPGFAPGDSEDQIRNRLGAPTREATVDGYYTSVYSLVPNRVNLAYVYEPDSIEVRQSEATFSPSTDRLVMRTALLGMLDGRSTRKIEEGLEAVRSGERDRFDFNRRGFTGAIERNAYGHVHIYVKN